MCYAKGDHWAKKSIFRNCKKKKRLQMGEDRNHVFHTNMQVNLKPEATLCLLHEPIGARLDVAFMAI